MKLHQIQAQKEKQVKVPTNKEENSPDKTKNKRKKDIFWNPFSIDKDPKGNSMMSVTILIFIGSDVLSELFHPTHDL